MLILIITTSNATLVVPGKLARIFEPIDHHVDTTCVIWATGFGLTGKTSFDFSWIGEKTPWNLTPAKMSEWNQVWFSKSSTHKQSESLCGLNCGFVNRLMSKTSCVSHQWLSHPVIPACSPKTLNRNSHQSAFFQNHSRSIFYTTKHSSLSQ